MTPDHSDTGGVVVFDQMVGQLHTDHETGLSSEEAIARLAAGRNELPAAPGPTLVERIWRNAKEPMSVLLMVAAAVSVVASGEVRDAFAILAIVVLNIAVAVAQEERASTALEALRLEAAPTATVLRAGQALVIPAVELVPGDVVLLAAGDRVPADTWLFATWSLEANESLLTGESLPVAKTHSEVGDMSIPMADQVWMAHAGSLITAGSGRGVVVTTGSSTVLGRIAGGLTAESPTHSPATAAGEALVTPGSGRRCDRSDRVRSHCRQTRRVGLGVRAGVPDSSGSGGRCGSRKGFLRL